MTIAAGFVCSDGLLFASDTLYSGQEDRFGRKFWPVLTENDTVVIFGGAGTEAGLKRTRDEVGERLVGTTTQREFVETIEAALKYVEEKLQPQPGYETYALVGIRIDGVTRLYENQAGKCMLNVVDYSSQCVGAGAALGLYFARSLFSESMPIAWAEVVAAHLIKNVKQYMSGCGGDTHLLELPNYGEPKLQDNDRIVHKLESYLGSVENAFRLVLPVVDTPDDPTLTYRMRQLRREIKKLRTDVVVETEGSPGITLGEWLEDTISS